MKTVLVTGTFDLVHGNHIRMLQYAKTFGDYLVVAVDTDERVAERKGKGRPILPLEERILLIREMKSVNMAVSFSSDAMLKSIITGFNVDTIVVGHEYENRTIVGRELVKNVVFFSLPRLTSTTKIIEAWK
jgi:rfaE bifunctional protein nucleotidyltransferase chain/domain